jgi:hypothetical protein
VEDSLRSSILVAQLRRHFFRHNTHVLSLAGFMFFTSVLLWMATYLFASWITLLVSTIVIEAQGGEAAMPPQFPLIFAAIAGALLVAAIVRRALVRNDMPRDSKSAAEYAIDFLLAVPATTVAVWSNLSAWLWLSQRELSAAAELLDRIVRDKRLPLHNTSVEIPDENRREKVVLGLLMTGVLDLRQEKGVTYLCLSPTRQMHEPFERLLTGDEA